MAYPRTNARRAATAPGTSARAAMWRSGWSFASLIPLFLLSRKSDDHEPRAADRSQDQPDGQEQGAEPEPPVQQVTDAAPDQQSSQQESDDRPGVGGVAPSRA